MPLDAPVTVIGAGFAGLAASDRLAAAGVPVVVYEASDHWGGHTRSITVDGFTFDEGPHVSFTTNPEVQELFARGAGEVEEFRAQITNWFSGHWIRHPAQVHLHGLDPELVTACIVDFVGAQGQRRKIRNYADWLEAMYGRTFAATFPAAYTRRYWTVDPRDLATDWVGNRMYPPKLDEVVRGALAPGHEGDFHYVSTCRYPRKGGYQAFMTGLLREDVLRLGRKVVRVDLRGRELRFEDGTVAPWSRLISTMPLPDLIAAIDPGQVPGGVRAAARRLLWTSLVLVDVAVDRPDLSDNHWFYVYDDMATVRGHFPHRLSPANAPDGCGSVQLEVYHSPHRPLPCSVENLTERVVDELVRMRILAKRSEVLSARSRPIRYANVVFDRRRAPALATILPWVEQQGILLAGRYGEWGYHWTDDATVAGWTAADRILSQ